MSIHTVTRAMLDGKIVRIYLYFYFLCNPSLFPVRITGIFMQEADRWTMQLESDRFRDQDCKRPWA